MIAVGSVPSLDSARGMFDAPNPNATPNARIADVLGAERYSSAYFAQRCIRVTRIAAVMTI